MRGDGPVVALSKARAMSEAWTIQTLIGEMAARGEAPALISVRGESSQALSYSALATRVSMLASGLMRLGIVSGAPVALVAPNGPDWVVTRLALGAIGALVVPVDDLAAESELQAALADSGCRHVLTSAAHVQRLRKLDRHFDLTVIGDDHPPPGERGWLELLSAPVDPMPPLSPDAPAMLVYTSGTTGAPKGFVLTYANLWANLRPLVAAGLIGPGDHVLLPLPLHHVYPFVVGLLTPLGSGAAVVFPESVAGPQIMQAIRNAEVSTIVGVPRLYAAITAGLEARVATTGKMGSMLFHALLGSSIWLKRRCGIGAGRWLFRRLCATMGPRLRLFVSGGARLEPDILWPLVGLGFEVRSGYGLAETASIFTGNLPGVERLESEGKPFQGGRLRIAEPDEQGMGEIQLRGPNVFMDYRNNADANRESFTTDGWFRTGDLGRLDADGFLYVTGRRKETIVLGGGKKVHPEELEKHYGSNPYVREIAVLERQGTLVALVLPNFEALRSAPTVRIDEAIRVALGSRGQSLPPYQRLAGFALAREPLPRTRLGKYQRFRLLALYEQALAGTPLAAPRALSPEDQELLTQPPARQVYEAIVKQYPGKRVDLDTNLLLDLGLDSLEWITFSLILEERLGLRFTETDIANVSTVRDLLHLTVATNQDLKQTVENAGARVNVSDASMKWLVPTGIGLTLVGMLVYGMNWLAMRVLFRLQVEGRENIPAQGPYALVPNHASDLDPLVLGAALGYRRARRLYWAGEPSRLFSRRWLHPLMRALHVFPVEERMPAQALALGAAVLRRGNDLAWFPEGWRSPDGKLQRFLPGLGQLLERVRVPAVPVHIAGSFEAMPRDRSWPRFRPIRVRIGPLLKPHDLIPPGTDANAAPRHILDMLRNAIVTLETQTSGR